MKSFVRLPFENATFTLVLGLVGLVVVMLLFYKLKGSSRFNKRTQDRLVRLQPILETIAILGGLSWIIWVLFRSQAVYSIVMIFLVVSGVLWLIRFLLYDISAGIVLRAENLFQPGDGILLEGQQAVIESIGTRCLTLVKLDGVTTRIPYSRLASMPLSKPTAHTTAKSHSFELSVKISGNYFDIIQRIKGVVLNSAWSLATLEPGIELLQEGEDAYRLKVTVYALKREYFPEIERSVRENII
mgnify:CR=1 FL=1